MKGTPEVLEQIIQAHLIRGQSVEKITLAKTSPDEGPLTRGPFFTPLGGPATQRAFS
ncbi:MAG: hypothetical protein M3Y08_14415 [Fibrobacterota bacterium]|nr:hypothetical protein [Fibrobacterota bacterium]